MGVLSVFLFQAEDGIRDLVRSRGLGDVYKRQLNSLQQGGLPVDVAETIAWLSQDANAGVSGQVVRVCGQSLIGA